MRIALLVCLLLLPHSSAGIVWIVHHPYPDDLDPLGVEFSQEVGFLEATKLAGRTWSYPYTIIDGGAEFQGIPAGDGAPIERVEAAYREAIESRQRTETPLTLEVSLQGSTVSVTATSSATEELQFFAATLDDHVNYEPPRQQSNGITDHRFVSKGVLAGPKLVQGATWEFEANLTNVTHIAIWVQQQGRDGVLFKANEVANAILVPVTNGNYVTTERNVLVEMLSATWCAPCALGDLAMEKIYVETTGETPIDSNRKSYIPSGSPFLPLLGIGLGTIAMLLVGRRI